jgi:hypothetical protein
MHLKMVKAISFMLYVVCTIKKIWLQPGMVAPTCNLSYLGGRDWEDHGLRPNWAKM